MSVKTGAVGSNPKIDKLINADAESLRRFAATTMLNKIMQTSAPVTGGSDENQVDPATAEAGRKTIRDNIMKTPASGNLEKGNYVKESDKENAIQKSLGMVVEMQRQKQAASVLAFSEDDAMKRNGIAEEDRKEFFANYLTLESEYLVEGAMLTCTQATSTEITIQDPVVSYQDHVYSDQPTKTENPLVKVKNPANDGKKKYATVSDCKKNVNINIFKNCKLTNASESKVLEKNNDCKKYGTCFALMDLCEKWVNVADGAAYGTAGAEFKNCINMLSHLGCYQGGIVFPLNTGQGELEEEIDFEALALKYGAMAFGDQEELTDDKVELANLVARIIYGEQSSLADGAQEAVAWTIINRLLSHNDKHVNQNKLNLKNVLTTPYQYDAIKMEDENDLPLAYSKKPQDMYWENWVKSVTLGYYITEAFGDYETTYYLSEEEIEGLRNEMVEKIGESPIGNGVSFRTTSDFDLNHTIVGDKHYYKDQEIYPPKDPIAGNTYFDYVDN